MTSLYHAFAVTGTNCATATLGFPCNQTVGEGFAVLYTVKLAQTSHRQHLLLQGDSLSVIRSFQKSHITNNWISFYYFQLWSLNYFDS
jgi:hypothetical protein